MIEAIYRARWLTAIAVVFSAVGALLMLVVGPISDHTGRRDPLRLFHRAR